MLFWRSRTTHEEGWLGLGGKGITQNGLRFESVVAQLFEHLLS